MVTVDTELHNKGSRWARWESIEGIVRFSCKDRIDE